MPKVDIVPASIAALVCVGFFALTFTLIFHAIPKENHDIITLVIGVIGGSAGTIVTFYFGSSKSSQSKDETLQEIAKS